MRPSAISIAALLAAFATGAAAQPVAPGTLRTYSTPQSIGVEWDVTGDPDDDATATVRFRVKGETTWRGAMPLFRVDFPGQNMLAGSVLFLEGGATYEVELALDDPDGGGETRTVDVSTQAVPERPVGGRMLHVAPGSGGGDGSAANPYQGIEEADAVAAPGDTFIVHGGSYGGAQRYFDTPGTAGQYVAWVAADGETPTFDDIRIRGDYIWVEGFDISAPTNAVRNEGPSKFAVVMGNRISGCSYCIHLNAGAEGWWISDNVIVGDQDPAGGSFDGEGVELQHTPGHTVAWNSISRVADGVSYPDHNVDIFGNDIFETSDDGVEADYAFANIRIWGNRISHANNNGITFQPMNGAPWYIIRNQVIGSAESVLKVRDSVDRVLLAHNTFVGWGRVYQNAAGFIRNMMVRNNIWITMTGEYLWEDTDVPAVPDSFRTDIDYDGFAWPDTTTNPLFKWHDVRYDDLAALQAGTSIEQNAIRTPMSCFPSLDVPGPAPAIIPPQHVTLASGCNAIDRGEVLANVNDGFVGAGPDLGAHESGAPDQHYGPRGPGAGGAGGAGGASGAGGAADSGATGTGGSAADGSGGSGQGADVGMGASAGTGGAAAGGAAASAGASGAAGSTNAASGSGDDGGCGCRVPRAGLHASTLGSVLLAVSALARRRRRGSRR